MIQWCGRKAATFWCGAYGALDMLIGDNPTRRRWQSRVCPHDGVINSFRSAARHQNARQQPRAPNHPPTRPLSWASLRREKHQYQAAERQTFGWKVRARYDQDGLSRRRGHVAAELARRSPSCWEHCVSHAAVIDTRGSSVHAKRARRTAFYRAPISHSRKMCFVPTVARKHADTLSAQHRSKIPKY